VCVCCVGGMCGVWCNVYVICVYVCGVDVMRVLIRTGEKMLPHCLRSHNGMKIESIIEKLIKIKIM